jgi:hypothetical protein
MNEEFSMEQLAFQGMETSSDTGRSERYAFLSALPEIDN